MSLIPDSKNADSPLSKPKVREAISYAIDREGIAKARGFGYWQPAYQLPNPGAPSYLADFAGQKYDSAKAKALLAEAGLASGFKTRIIIMPALVDKDAMTAVQANLAAVGIPSTWRRPTTAATPRCASGVAGRMASWPSTRVPWPRSTSPTTSTSPSRRSSSPRSCGRTGFLDKLSTSIRTPAPDPKLGLELTKSRRTI